MGKTVLIGGIVLLIITLGFIFISNRNEASFLLRNNESNIPAAEKNSQQQSLMPEQTHQVDKQASFAIFTHGTFRDFTASMYHNLSEDVYIQADNPNIVHIKRSGITWDDFFKTLPFSLTKNCLTTGTKETFCTKGNDSLRFYLNGSLYQNALDKEIKASDQLMVTFGREDIQQIQGQIQQLQDMIN